MAVRTTGRMVEFRVNSAIHFCSKCVNHDTKSARKLFFISRLQFLEYLLRCVLLLTREQESTLVL